MPPDATSDTTERDGSAPGPRPEVTLDETESALRRPEIPSAGNQRRQMSPRRKFRLARTILVALVVLAIAAGLMADMTAKSPDVTDTSWLEGFQPEEGGGPPAASVAPVAMGEQVPIPPRAKSVPISGEWTYAVVVEKGMPDGDQFTSLVDRVLGDARGWSRRVRFRKARQGETPVFTVLLVSPENVDRLCQPLKTDGTYSCGLDGRAVINALRWRDGPVETATAAWSNDSQDAYRTMVVNHEVGHVLGLGHQTCKTPGTPSSIMAQQTIDLRGCLPNPWPIDDDLARLR